MRSLPSSLILVACGSVFTSADSAAVKWTVDEDTLPESLPGLMRDRGYSDEDVRTAVFQAYRTQYDVISEHNGHVFDPEPPLGYFEDSLTVPRTRASAFDSDVVFTDNTVNGLTGYESSNIVVRWSRDRVFQQVAWKELYISGKYALLDELHYINGKYKIVVEDVTYQAETPLSRNTELYPSSAPDTAISYSKFRAAFTGDKLISTEIPATRYFLEEVVFRQVANYVIGSMRKNVTSAIRAAIRPYVLYKNQSDSHFPGTTGRLEDGRDFVVTDPFVDGLDNVVQKLKAVWPEPNSGPVIILVEYTLHNLSGTFDLRVQQRASERAVTATAQFSIAHVSLNIAFNALQPNCYCSISVQLIETRAWPKIGDSGGRDVDWIYQQAAAAFFEGVRHHFSVGTCTAIVNMNKYGHHNPYCPSPLPHPS